MAYATLAQLAQYGLPASVLATIANADQTAALTAMSEDIDEALRVAGYAVPLVSWSSAITRRVCEAASYQLLCVKGFQPDELDENIRTRYEDYLAWKASVASRALLVIDQTQDATPTEDEYQPLVYSDEDRGW